MRSVLIASLDQVRADNGGLGLFRPGWVHPHRTLTSSVLILGVRGAVPLVVAGEALTVVPGRVVVLPAGWAHGGPAALTEPAAYLWMHFSQPGPTALLSPEEADTILSHDGVSGHRLDNAALVPLGFDLADAPTLELRFRELLALQERPGYTGRKFQLLFQLLLVHLTEAVLAAHRPPARPSASSRVVYGIVALVAEHLTDPNLSIKAIAPALGVGADYAGRRFRHVMGVSVGEYLLVQRLRLAMSQLTQTQATVDAVAAACGFGSPRHFLRQFKRVYGVTPTEARARSQALHFSSS